MFKPNDVVKFGDMVGVIVTINGANDKAPIQVIFAKQKQVLGFREDGQFFSFDGGPKLIPFKPSLYIRMKARVKMIINKVKI